MLDIIAEAFVLEDVLPFFALADVGKLEVARPLMRRTVLSSRSWKEVACREVPSFLLNFTHTVDNRDIKALISVLRRTAVAERSPIALNSFRHAADIVTIVSKFQRQASAQLLAGGVVASVIVGRFHFANNQVAGNGAHRLADQDQLLIPDARFSTPLTTSCQLPSGALPCKIRLVAQKDEMLLSAKLGAGLANRAALPQLSVDVQAVSDSILLQMRNVSVKPDGASVEKGSGLCTRRASQKAADKALADGLLCVLLVREDMHEAGVKGRTADALNLDDRAWNPRT